MSVYIETGFGGDEFTLENPRIGYSRPEYQLVSGSTSEEGFDASNAATPRTDSAWRPTSVPTFWRYNYSSSTEISYLGIAKHDLGTLNATIRIQISNTGDNSNYSTIPGLTITPEDDSPILCLFDPVSVTDIRVSITAADDNPTISVIAAGPVMEWPQPSTWTGTPITESDQTTFSNNLSDKGNFLGRTTVSDGLSFSLDIDNLSEAFRTSDFAAFKAHANGEVATFFVAPRPEDYPDEVAYAWSDGVVNMSRERANHRNSGSVSLSLQGLRVDG